jgi:hypothetical protein
MRLRCPVLKLAIGAAIACLLSSCGTIGARESESAGAQRTRSASESCPTIPPATHRRDQMNLQPPQARPGENFRAVYANLRTRNEVLYLTPARGACTTYVLSPGLGDQQWKEIPQQGTFAITATVTRTSQLSGVVPDPALPGAYSVCDDAGNCANLEVLE